MNLTPDTALLDELITCRLDEILPQKLEEKLAELKTNKTPAMTMEMPIGPE